MLHTSKITMGILVICAMQIHAADRPYGLYKLCKKFQILADHSLHFAPNGKTLIPVAYAGKEGFDTKNYAIDIEQGSVKLISDTEKAILLKDAGTDGVLRELPMISVKDARGFGRPFACSQSIEGADIRTIAAKDDLWSIARSADQRYIAIGRKAAVVDLYKYES